jgi:hypothetical protein
LQKCLQNSLQQFPNLLNNSNLLPCNDIILSVLGSPSSISAPDLPQDPPDPLVLVVLDDAAAPLPLALLRQPPDFTSSCPLRALPGSSNKKLSK